MGYAATAVRGLEACPFCREMFPPGEHADCPLCGVGLVPAARLPSQADGDDADDELDGRGRAAPKDPTERILPWAYWGKARGPLLVLTTLGLIAFCLPWVHSFTPERVVYSGIDIARRTGLAWSVGVAWFTLLPLILTRRTIRDMRGARLAVAVLAVIPAIVAATLLLNPPQAGQAHGVVVRLRYAWEPAIYATVVISLVTSLLAALGFGGKIAPAPANPPVPSDPTLN
jgi:hypothetical protein